MQMFVMQTLMQNPSCTDGNNPMSQHTCNTEKCSIHCVAAVLHSRRLAVQVIVDKMIDYLRGTTDEVTKTDVVRRIGELAERFAPDTQWFLDTMNQVSNTIRYPCTSSTALLIE